MTNVQHVLYPILFILCIPFMIFNWKFLLVILIFLPIVLFLGRNVKPIEKQVTTEPLKFERQSAPVRDLDDFDTWIKHHTNQPIVVEIREE